MTDEQLFQRYNDRDAEVFRVLVDRYEPRIQDFLRKRLHDEERVQDLTQDTFLRIHRARESYDPSRKFSTWIHTIANNLLKNEFRNRSRRRETIFSDLRPESSNNGAPSRPVEFESRGADTEQNTYPASCVRPSTRPSRAFTSPTACPSSCVRWRTSPTRKSPRPSGFPWAR